MSFGGPGLRQPTSKPIPPERGSFPLDHDGECKHLVSRYLTCIKQAQGTNAPDCRALAKGYLACRMDRNLMAPDEMRNLGFAEDDGPASATAATTVDANANVAAGGAEKEKAKSKDKA